MKPSGKLIVNDVRGEAFKTKSGKYVIVLGGTPKQEEARAGPVVKYYNKDFTSCEQKKIGNVVYDLNYHIPQEYDGVAQWLKNKDPNHPDNINPHHKRIGRFNVSKESANREGTIVHELIHIRRYAMGRPIGKDEKRVVYETGGRTSHKGFTSDFPGRGGEYFMQIPKFSKLRTKHQIHAAAPLVKAGMVNDRVRLTGSMRKSSKGQRFDTKVERTFPTSFIKRGKIIK